MSFRKTVSMDLAANVGKKGFKAGLMAFIFHPGFSTIFLHRLAMAARTRGFGRFGNLIWIWNVRRSGCHFHPDCILEPGIYLPHPTAIVIGSGCHIGSGSTIYQGVTLGKGANDAYPVVGQGVTIYPNSVVIGGITIGNEAVVGAASVVLKDIPAGAVAAGNPSRIIRQPKNVAN